MSAKRCQGQKFLDQYLYMVAIAGNVLLMDTEQPKHICPDCGEPIELVSGGAWWRHVGLNGDCWRLSMDGPGNDDE